MKLLAINKLSKYTKATLLVVLISFLVRAFFANAIELGNDEIYYWLLAKHPALSFFDHPPMFAWFINLFSFGLFFDSELFIRLSSLIVFSLNTWILFLIGRQVKNERTGFIAALLYQSSIYTFVITGIMIIPDTPLSLFWLLAIRSLLLSLSSDTIQKKQLNHMLLSGLFIGLAILSKYHALILWAGTGAYILFHKRVWLLKPQLYISVVISVLCLMPIFIWNYSNDWASLNFQSDRISVYGEIQPLFFMREFFGQLVYNNPINVIIILIALFSFKKSNFLDKSTWRILLWLGLPLALTFLFFSIFRPTFPHWSAPAYFALIIIGAAYLESKSNRFIPLINSIAIGVTILLIGVAFSQINYGVFYGNTSENPMKLGENDVTLDLYGWSQIADKFQKESLHKHPGTKTIVARKWYNAAHIDYYVAQKNQLKLIALGSIMDIHEYERINNIRGNLKAGDNAWFIAVSRDYQDPYIHFSPLFENIEAIDTIAINRNSDIVEYAFVYYLEGYISN